jgi:hypothetical protein
MKTSELTGAALDWAVAKCEGKNITLMRNTDGSLFPQPVWADGLWQCNYSHSWSQGGPIIEREWLDVTPWPNESDEDLRWQCVQHDSTDCLFFGPTPLIAAMRCFVASRLGDEVDIPEELL